MRMIPRLSEAEYFILVGLSPAAFAPQTVGRTLDRAVFKRAIFKSKVGNQFFKVAHFPAQILRYDKPVKCPMVDDGPQLSPATLGQTPHDFFRIE